MVEKTDKRIKKRKIKWIGSILLPIALLVSSSAWATGLRLISDEETEQMLREIAAPLFGAAGVKLNPNELFVVDDKSLNAFVADGNALFVHTGTIMNAGSANELAGVIAHETGHIAGGHILRQKLKAKALQDVSLVSVLAAGTAAVLSGNADVAMAAMIGSQSSLLTNYTRYRTEEERSADEAALKLLEATKQSPKGMLAFMKRIAQHQRLQGIEETPYFRTHPITSERISFFERAVKSIKNEDAHSPMQNKFERVKAKLFAYLNSPQQTFQKYPETDVSVAGKYARAIAYFKLLKLQQAQKLLDELITIEPNNPYFHEMKGQIFMETGKIKEAKQEYRKALEILPSSALLQMSYAQAVMEDTPNKNEAQKVVTLLNKAIIKHPTGFAWLLLARTYGYLNLQAEANYASAEYSVRIGALDTALEQLKIAKKAKPNQRLALKIDDLEHKIDTMQKK